jgi:hypothetical protein
MKKPKMHLRRANFHEKMISVIVNKNLLIHRKKVEKNNFVKEK